MLNLHTAIKGALVASAVSIAGAAGAADAPKVAVDLTTLTSPFWTSYNKYIVVEAKAQGVDLLQPFNSEFDTGGRSPASANSISPLYANGIIFSPFDYQCRPRARCLPRPAAAAKVPVAAARRGARHRSRGGDRGARQQTSPTAARRPVTISATAWRKARWCGRSWATRFFDQWTRPWHGFPRLHQEELSGSWSYLKSQQRPCRAKTRLPASTPPFSNSTPDRKADSSEARTREASSLRFSPTLQMPKRRVGSRIRLVGEAVGHVIIVSNDVHPAGIRRHPQGRGRCDRVPAGGPRRQIRHHVPEGGDRRPDIQGRPDRPRTRTIVEAAPGVLEDQLVLFRWSPLRGKGAKKRMSTTSRSGVITFKGAEARRPMSELFDARRAAGVIPVRPAVS